MKNPLSILFFVLVSAASLPAAVTITVANNVTNGTASGGSGTGPGLISTSSGAISSNRLLPVTTYTVTGVNLTSVGGTASESFTFTVGYTASGGSPTFSGFGNVGVGGNGLVNDAETITATINLTSSTFAELSLTGFTYARAGAMGAGESGTFSWTGGSFNVSTGNTVANSVTGNSFSFAVSGTSTLNLEGFGAQFVAVPESTSTSLLALGATALLRRRRRA
jgi:hypothetical protein